MSTLNEKRIEIAKSFVESHKCCEEWKKSLYSDDDYLTVYHNILSGVYGDCNDDDRDDGEHRIEIDGYEHISGNPVLFDFYPIIDNNAIKKLEKSW